MMSFNNSNTSRDATDDEGPMARAPKRQKLSYRTYKNGSALTAFSHGDYTIGWICALPKEMSAAAAMLDIEHETLPRGENDTNTYTLGSIAAHNVVIACLPSGCYGNNNAATVASNMRRTFPAIRLCLMVGIGGGAPGKADIRLGDVVVGKGVLQYDLGKTVSNGHFKRTGNMTQPPKELLTAIAKLQGDYNLGPSQIPSILAEMLERHPTMGQFIYRESLQDQLFDSTYDHVQSTDSFIDDCKLCDESRLVTRPPRDNANPKIHYGTIASGNQVMRHGKTRVELADELGALCFEMEGAGVMDGFAGLVIRGICDYSDSHKNKQWQEVAAAVAAAYAKELLLVIPTDRDKIIPMVALPSVDMDRQQNLLNSLKFEQIDARRSNIKEKYSKTCQWLLKHPDYLYWLDPKQAVEHHGFLWISGNPGTGKSTIMNFAYKETMKDKQKKVISFFFNARGDNLERSTPGMYRSLLFQLLNALPNLLKVFDEPEYKDSLDELHTALLGHRHTMWHTKVLQGLLQSALAKLGQEPLTIFVDALDECAPDQVEELVDYFEELGTDAVQNGSRLNICFSSRHYPHIDIQYGRKITLEIQDGHEKDIAMYIQNKLKVGKSKTAEEVKTEIQTKAKGIFMWVVLVVDILKAEYRGGRIFDVKKRLAALPTKLSDLFKDILSRDQKNLRDLQLCIQWILFAKRPLKLEEYYFAAVSELRPVELQEWNLDEVTTDDMSRFVISSSKGLAETTKSKIRTVQFIHESVREFFLKDGLHELWPNLATADFESTSHNQLQQCCYAYFGFIIASRVAESLPLPKTLGKPSSDEAKQVRGALSDKFPFLEYTTRHIFYHADVAASSIPQHEFLCHFPLETWITLDNFFEMFEVRRHTPTASLLYILAENNFARLIKNALYLDPNIDIKGERHNYPLFAALANDHQRAAMALLQTEASHLGDDVIARLDYGSSFRVKKDQTPLLWAAEKGYEAVVRLLLEKGSDIKAKDRSSRTPLSHAAENGHIDIVRLLLEKGSDLEAENIYLQTPLSHAAENGHIDIVRLLLEKGSDLEAKNVYSQTPLSHAAENGHIDIVRLLLEKGSGDTEAKGGALRMSLSLAAERGHIDVVRLLLEKGSDLEAKNIYSQTPLSHAAENGHIDIVRLLLEKGSDLETKDKYLQTPLLYAAENGHIDIVRLLLEKGSDLETKDKYLQTPLLYAAKKGHIDIVRLLLKKGADIEVMDSEGRTALSLAKDRATVELLDSHYYISACQNSYARD